MRYNWKQRRIPPLGPSAQPHVTMETVVRERGPFITLVTDATRQRMEAGIAANERLVHATSVSDALARVETTRASVVLISPNALQREEASRVGRLLVAMTRVVAVLDEELEDPSLLLELGARGLREAVNLRECKGWNGLRQILQDGADPVASRIGTVVFPPLEGAAPGARRFFAHLVRLARTTRTVRLLSGQLGIEPSTLTSRFHRAALPSPKLLLCSIRLLFAKALLEEPRRSVSSVANELGYSSPQAFGRHVRLTLRVSIGEMRRNVTFADLAGHLVEHLIVRHLPTYRRFDPFTSFGGVHALASEDQVHLYPYH